MRSFGKVRPRVRGVVDVGSDTIKALLFEVDPAPAGGTAINSDGILGRVRPIEKFVWELPASYSTLNLVRKIRENVFAMVRRVEQAPEEILIALGPTVAEYATRIWRIAPEGNGKILTRADIREYWRRLTADNTDLRRAMIAAPIGLAVNGYPLIWGENWFSEEVLPSAQVRDISFRTLSLYMTVENGAMFAEIKNSLGGMPVEFIPLALVEKEAVSGFMGVREALVADVGGDETSLFVIRQGRFEESAFIPFGTRGFAEALGKKTGLGFTESRAAMRQYVQGMGDERSRSLAAEAASRAAGQWKELFSRALESFYAGGPMPENVLLAGGGARFPELRRVLAAPDWLSTFSHTDTPALRALEGSTFFDGDTLGGHLSGSEDVGLASLLIYSLSHQSIF